MTTGGAQFQALMIVLLLAVLFLAGAASITAGAWLLLGMAPALIVVGAFLIMAAYLVRNGMSAARDG